MIDKIKHLSFPLVILILSIFIILTLIPNYHPFGDLKVSKDEQTILKESEIYLKKLGINYDENKIDINFEQNEGLSRWIKSEYKLDSANTILRNTGFAYYWSISQNSTNRSGFVVTSDSNETIKNIESSYQLKLSEDGKIIEFEQQIVDTSIKSELTPEKAQLLSINLVQKLRNDIQFAEDSVEFYENSSSKIFFFKQLETVDKPGRVDYNFIWQTKTSGLLNYSLQTRIIGDHVSRFSIEVIIPKEFEKDGTDIFEIATTILFMLLIIISVVIVGFKRFRDYEVGFKMAIAFAIIVLVSFVFKEFLELIYLLKPDIILGLSVGGFFLAGAALILWAVSETLFREIWNEKLLSLDLIFHRNIFHSKIGISIVRSISFGLGLTALFYSLIFLISPYIPIDFTGDNFTSQSHLVAYIPLLNIFLGVFNAYGILAVAFFVFLTAAVKRYINNDIIFVIVCALTWTIFIPSGIGSLTVGIPINFIIGILLCTILIRYDLLSTLLSFLIFKFFIKATEFSFLDNPNFINQWHYLIIICSMMIALGIIMVLRKDKFTDYDSITPKFVENITERQRLKKELDVARHVQMSFLPKENPKYEGIDIDSVCIPALEVGGDYYDFINLGDYKLGIIIGDVSGKGTQAAFYMTLTKGFLKALAKQSASPAEVLTKMNELFYENVERGRFISMIYAIIDLDTKKITIARAGHNPIIFQDNVGKINLISPRGLALGLEKGDLFGKVIDEHEESLSPGKLFIFYTDGFSEAVNKKGEEYGLEKIFDIAQSNKLLSSTEIKSKIVADVTKFIGKARQHDDMTMVVLKIV